MPSSSKRRASETSSILRSTTSGATCMCVSNAPHSSSRARLLGGCNSSGTAQRLRDVTEVIAHRLLGRDGVARRDRIDDRLVLGERSLAAAGEQDRAVLEADQL